VDYENVNAYPVRSVEFRSQMQRIVKTEVKDGNSVETISDGNIYFSRMLGDIRRAKTSVELEMFIMREGQLAKQFVRELVGSAKRGVSVKVVLDAIGSKYLDSKSIKSLKESGVKLELYKPISKNLVSFNNRNHRKYLIVDSQLAYTGGTGISDIWVGSHDLSSKWRDTMYRITGPIVNDMRYSFYEHWNEFVKQDQEKTVNSEIKKGRVKVQEVLGGGKEHKNKIVKSYYAAIAGAQKEIVFSMAYTCPPSEIKRILKKAIDRGVVVKALIPSKKTDSKITRRCGHHFWKEMSEYGVIVYEYLPSVFHVKTVVVDRHLSIIGAANLDYRSMFINEENNLMIYDDEFASEQLEVFDKDIKHSSRLQTEDFEGFDIFAHLFQYQL